MEENILSSLLKLMKDYNSNLISRDDFWYKCKKHHLQLREYQKILSKHSISNIVISENNLIVQLKNGLRFIWNPEDIRTAISLIINMGEYEEAEHKLLEIIASKSNFILDIGANIGWYALHLNLAQPTDGKLYAFEAVTNTFNILKVNVNLNEPTKIKLFNLALGERLGEVQFYIPKNTGSVAASRVDLYKDTEKASKINCEMITLDSWIKENNVNKIDLIKCDVEGSELMVLNGGKETIKKHKPLIFLEMLRKWSALFNYHPNEIIYFLSKFQYETYAIDIEVDSFILRKVYEIKNEEEATNFLFINEKTHSMIFKEIRDNNISIIE